MKAIMRDKAELSNYEYSWMGSLPISWNKPSLLYVLRTKISDGPHETPEYVENGIPFISIDSLNETKNISLKDCKRYITEEDYIRFSHKTRIEKDDILFSKAATIGKTAIIKDEKIMVWSPLAIIKANQNIINNEYLYHVLNCDKLIMDVSLSGSMNTQINVGMRELEHVKIPLPPFEEQQIIANYLDDRCFKIDAIIAEAKASIEEYESWKQSVIAEKTTKGLDKKCNLKDSGFIWMGKIPEHWELRPFRNILKERNEKNNPIKSKERLSLSIDKGVTLYAEKTTNLDRFKDDFTAYKLAYKGDLVMNSMNMIVGASGVSEYFGCVSPVYYTYYDDTEEHITAKYCEYLFRSRMLMRVLHSMGRGIYSIDRGDDRVNTCRLKISRNDLRTLILPLPPLKEQYEIVDYLDTHIAKVDELISEKQSLIEDLESYKKSLIYEVVTGKRKVVE